MFNCSLPANSIFLRRCQFYWQMFCYTFGVEFCLFLVLSRVLSLSLFSLRFYISLFISLSLTLLSPISLLPYLTSFHSRCLTCASLSSSLLSLCNSLFNSAPLSFIPKIHFDGLWMSEPNCEWHYKTMNFPCLFNSSLTMVYFSCAVVCSVCPLTSLFYRLPLEHISQRNRISFCHLALIHSHTFLFFFIV